MVLVGYSADEFSDRLNLKEFGRRTQRL